MCWLAMLKQFVKEKEDHCIIISISFRILYPLGWLWNTRTLSEGSFVLVYVVGVDYLINIEYVKVC